MLCFVFLVYEKNIHEEQHGLTIVLGAPGNN